MKGKLRKFLAMVMVLVMACGLVSTAAAANDVTLTPSDWQILFGYYNCQQGNHTAVYSGGKYVCQYCGTTLGYNNNYNNGYYGGTYYDQYHSYAQKDATCHTAYCTLSSCTSHPYYSQDELHTYNAYGYCYYCGYYGGYYGGGYSDLYHTYYQNDATTHYVYCANSSCVSHSSTVYTYEAHTYNTSGYCYYCGYNYYGTTGTGLIVTPSDNLGVNDTYTVGSTQLLSVDARVYSTSGTDITSSYTLTYSWRGSVTAYSTYYGYYDYMAYLDTSSSAAYAYCTVTATPTTASGLTDTLTQTVTWYATAGVGTAANVIYTARTGQNVKLDQTDFTDFWKEVYPYGTLSYVTFTSITPGYLYDDYSSSAYSYGNVTAGTTCYLNPSSTYYKGLDDLTYVPGTTTTAATIQFTATGTTDVYGYSTASQTGTITILYTSKEVPAIEYASTSEGGTMDAQDFIDVYKDVMGATYVAGSSLTIEFLDVPAYGAFYVDRTTYYNGTQLTAANVSSYDFSCSTTAARNIEDLTYIPGTLGTTESVQYACYYGSQLQYVGTVTFNKDTTPDIQISTSIGKAVTFSYTDFSDLESSVVYLSFGTPESGTLYKNYANGTGTKIDSSDVFYLGNTYAAYSLNNVTYVPQTWSAGTVKIPYSGYTVNGKMISGIVQINVGKNFSDVTDKVWSQSYILRLSAQGIVDGGNGGKFYPNQNMKYGEALKLVLEAAGYGKQSKTGTHWASGYLTLAYNKGLVSSANIDLESEVNRDTLVTIAAKALGLSSATTVNAGISKPSDSANGYVYAMYNAGIIDGVNTNGQNYFLGTNAIQRGEVCKIVCGIMDYVG